MIERKTIHSYAVTDTSVDFDGADDDAATVFVKVTDGPTCMVRIEDGGTFGDVQICTDDDEEPKPAESAMAEVVRHYAWAAWHTEEALQRVPHKPRLRAV